MIRFLAGGLPFEQQALTRLRALLWVTLFTAGNLLVPALVHGLPQGGSTWLPIYAFTLIGAYRYGWQVGLAVALLSPLANHLLTGMPPLAVLDAVLVKSVALALLAGLWAQSRRSVSLAGLLIVVAGYQVLGLAYESVRWGSVGTAAADTLRSWPGLAVQVVGGAVLLSLWNGRGRQTPH